MATAQGFALSSIMCLIRQNAKSGSNPQYADGASLSERSWEVWSLK